MNSEVTPFFSIGCGRCPFGSTPQCKVNAWREELLYLRSILLESSLTEELKWGVPCYTFQSNNVLVLSALKDCAVVGFFKGVLLTDSAGILSKPGESSQAVRQIKFKSLSDAYNLTEILKAYIAEAIGIEKAELKVEFKPNPEPIPDELLQKFEEMPSLKTAFERLTRGKQRGFVIYFSAPKQSKTRLARIEKCLPLIFNGKGLHD